MEGYPESKTLQSVSEFIHGLDRHLDAGDCTVAKGAEFSPIPQRDLMVLENEKEGAVK